MLKGYQLVELALISLEMFPHSKEPPYVKRGYAK